MKRCLYALVVLILSVSCADKPVVIIQIADAQLGFDAAEKAKTRGEYVNDLTYESELLSVALAEINGMAPDAVVFTGDQVNRPTDVEQLDAFDALAAQIDTESQVLYIPGNHDVIYSDGNVDVTPFTSRYGDDRFVFQNKKYCLVGINSNLIKYDDPREEDQFEWMCDVLSSAGEKTVKIIFCHHPFFMTDIEEEDSYFPIQKAKRQKYFDMFAQMGVDAVYAGHRHDTFEGEYKGIPMKTSTSVAYQIGKAKPSYRAIVIEGGKIVSDDLHLVNP